METPTNLMRRRDNTEGEGGKSNSKTKKIPIKTIPQKQRPAQIISPLQQPKNTPADPTEFPLS